MLLAPWRAMTRLRAEFAVGKKNKRSQSGHVIVQPCRNTSSSSFYLVTGLFSLVRIRPSANALSQANQPLENQGLLLSPSAAPYFPLISSCLVSSFVSSRINLTIIERVQSVVHIVSSITCQPSLTPVLVDSRFPNANGDVGRQVSCQV